MVRRLATLIAVLALFVLGLPANANAGVDAPAAGTIIISDSGFGIQWWWSYGGDISCQFSANGPAGVASLAQVTCDASQGLVSRACPMMVVTRTTETWVGARASCDSVLDMGVGSSGVARANLGHVYSTIICQAYVDYGVLTPPYSVTCDEPGPPTMNTALTTPAG